jgi:hypothetical protein
MNYKMLILIFILILGVIGISGCTDIIDSITVNVFNESGVYFEYPSNWKSYKPLDGNGEIAAVGNVNESGNSTIGEYAYVFKHDKNEYSAKKAISNFKMIDGVNYTESSIIVDGVNATLIKFTWKNETDTIGTLVEFEKNGYTYEIEYFTTPPEKYNEKIFKHMINSFKVQ